MSELTVVLKDAERTYRQKFVIYQPFLMDCYDPIILQCIKEAKENFQGEPEDVQIKTHMEVV